MTEIAGGTDLQRALLAAVVAGLGNTALELVRLEPWADEGEGDLRLTPDEVEASRGTAVFLVRPETPDVRTHWELTIAARAFAEASEEHGSDAVVWVASRNGGSVLPGPRPTPLEPDDVAAVEPAVVAAADAAGARVERFDVLRPRDPAWAVTLAVDEPHEFMRHRLRSFLEATTRWRSGYDSCVEIRDGGDDAVWAQGLHGWGGSTATRVDVLCCAPYRGGSIDDPGPPPCPVFG